MYDSETYLKEFFPYFLTKDTDNNFNKLLRTLNTGFKQCRQRIDETYLLNKLYRPILVQRSQTEPYKCTHTVICDIEDIKTIKVYKNEELIDTIEFKYEDHVDEFEKNYTDLNEIEIIVHDIYIAEVETYNEFKYVAGDYIYDEKLDTLGKLIDCKRLSFKSVEPYEYPYTYPPYNTEKLEDDYSYVCRMAEYLSLMAGMPSPCLYLWKNYLVETELVNCSGKVAKIDEYIAVPENDSVYLYNDISTLFPLQDSFLKVDSVVYDDNFEKMNGQSAVYIKGAGDSDYHYKGLAPLELFVGNADSFSVKSKYIAIGEELPVKDEILVEQEYDIYSPVDEINPRPLGFADYYVSVDGDDSNDGLTRETAFKTLQKALSIINMGEAILLLDGDYELSETIEFDTSCFIQGESAENTIITVKDDVELQIQYQTNITLRNLTIAADKEYTYSSLVEYENKAHNLLKIVGESIDG